MKQNKGITLVALIITIIVMIILAGVTISLTLGDNGIFSKAKRGGSLYSNAQDEERTALNSFEEQIAGEGRKAGPIIPENALAKNITAADYGKTINYSIDLDEVSDADDWKVFYNDGINVFIIATSPLKANKVDNLKMGMITNNNYAYWNSVPNYETIDSYIAQKYMFNFDYEESLTNANFKCLSTLLNKDNWSHLVDSQKADSAIGGATLEMWIASWNEVYPSNKLYCNRANKSGYYIGYTTEPKTLYINNGYKEGYNNSLYFLNDDIACGSISYWLASTSAANSNIIMDVSNAGSIYYYGNYYRDEIGLRPVICLKAETTGTIGTTVTID